MGQVIHSGAAHLEPARHHVRAVVAPDKEGSGALNIHRQCFVTHARLQLTTATAADTQGAWGGGLRRGWQSGDLLLLAFNLLGQV